MSICTLFRQFVTSKQLLKCSIKTLKFQAPKWFTGRTMIRTISTNTSLKRKAEVTMLPNGVFIDSGSASETVETNGSAHFLEHLLFKGTQKRTRMSLEKEVENIGGQLNAYTSREHTVYYSKVFKRDVNQAIDILSDILLYSKLETDAIEEEKYVILREMEEVEKNVEEVIFDQLHTSVFRGNPLSFTILGPPQNISNMNREILSSRLATQYTPKRMVFVGVGDINHSDFVNTVNSHMGSLRNISGMSNEPVVPKPTFFPIDTIEKLDDKDTGHIAVAYEAAGWKNPQHFTFLLIQSLLSYYDSANDAFLPGSLSIHPSVTIMSKKLTPHSFVAFNGFTTIYKNTGLFGFYMKASADNLMTYVNELGCYINGLPYSLTEEYLDIAKRQLRRQILESLESTTSICEDIGRHLLVYNKHFSALEFLQIIENITKEQVIHILLNHVNRNPVAFAAQMPYEMKQPSANDLRLAKCGYLSHT
ncbi:uncharacterized protein LOC128883740 isoform X3 [Hylaeus volcanicus]|uniref:uncharacterized protein LOC128883740 isoform X3 n=1 Tax=Hylaeus volcanicus TaxID=313075 RepID=UPI0023B8543C|nr:uncharacterized protein LOC128883740 isoform X3 [Hylaeus volcanicus]